MATGVAVIGEGLFGEFIWAGAPGAVAEVLGPPGAQRTFTIGAAEGRREFRVFRDLHAFTAYPPANPLTPQEVR